jgi:ribonuclease J
MEAIDQPGKTDFWFIPLGGTGEIGMNLNLYGHDDQWLMVDCGISFLDELDKNGFNQSRVIMPDIEFARSLKDKIVGLVVTHAHEDHLGAIHYLWPELGCPIYTTRFTRQVLLNKLLRANCPAPVIEIDPDEPLQLGSFSIDLVAMTHSTPETHGLVISTAAGRVFHTADWKLDPTPIVGPPASETKLRELGSLDAVITDSTNALQPNRATSEASVHTAMLELIQGMSGRVVVTCFASNIARLQTLARVAEQTGRYLGLLGASLETMYRAARQSGYLQDVQVFACRELSYLPGDEVLIVATGSQGQPGSALHRLALEQHQDVNLESGDHVIFSSKTIPGNEKSIERLLDHLESLGVRTWQAEGNNLALHGSGHGGAPELLDLFTWTQPALVVPVHGEPAHLEANAELARQAGVPHQLVGQNGDRFDLVHQKRQGGFAPTGVLQVNNDGSLTSI